MAMRNRLHEEGREPNMGEKDQQASEDLNAEPTLEEQSEPNVVAKSEQGYSGHPENLH